ncbi:MAG: matrixin family metalloprotease [Deltaproteobacteria bacterium]|nr:matrixin family metalloprotease [Deltaproteobacteria bacterium]MCB9786000.1 matrixin family metalloprotease [Deltaproteobacteria bacterium]
MPAPRTLTLAALLVASATLAPPAAAFVLYETDAGQPLHWPSKVAPALTLDPSFPGDADPTTVSTIVARAAARWTSLPCMPPTVALAGYAACGGEDPDDGTNCLFRVSDPQRWEHGVNQVALTLVHFDNRRGAIVDVDMVLNAAWFGFATEADCQPSDADLDAVLTHELGHFFGLDHSTVPEATMAPTSGPGDCQKRDLAPDDIAGFCAIYGVRRDEGGGGCGAGGPTAPWTLPAALAILLARAAWRRRRSPAPTRPR